MLLENLQAVLKKKSPLGELSVMQGLAPKLDIDCLLASHIGPEPYDPLSQPLAAPVRKYL
jgi:hypothetical protein